MKSHEDAENYYEEKCTLDYYGGMEQLACIRRTYQVLQSSGTIRYQELEKLGLTRPVTDLR